MNHKLVFLGFLLSMAALLSIPAQAHETLGRSHDSYGEDYEGEDGDISFVSILAEGDNWLKLISKFG